MNQSETSETQMRNTADEQSFLTQIQAIFKKKKEDAEQEFSPYFYTYHKRLFEHPQMFKAYSKTCKHIFDVTNAKGKNVLDIGCGFGLISILLGVFGAKVVGVDPSKEKIKVFEKIFRSLVPPLGNVEVRLGDALESDFKDEYFDVVVCNEVVSHVRDLDLFLLKMNKALKRRGVFYISDNNNKLNILQRHERRKVWEEAECKYNLLRKKMIRQKFPTINDEALDLLVGKTRGMYGDQIFMAVREYMCKRKIPQEPTFKYRHPETGITAEFEYNPFILRKILHKFGFKAKILRPYFVADHPSLIERSIKKFLAQTVRFFHPLSLLASTKFEILAEKP